MHREPIYPGELVISTAGHDKGRSYIVLRTEDEFAYLVDGRLRTLDKPKKKNLRHVAAEGSTAQLELISCDAHVRKAIKHFNKIKSEGGCHLG